MLQKLAVPFIVLSFATFGCSTNSSSTEGGATEGGATEGGGDAALAACTVTTELSTDVLSAATFCAHLAAKCTGVTTVVGTMPAAYMNMCMQTYNMALNQHCQSYHLCWGVEGLGGGPASPTDHCGHAWAAAVCN